MADPDELVMYLVFRGDLKLSKGKVAAQAGHAVQLVIRAVERECDGTNLAAWEAGSYAKIAVKVPNEAEFDELLVEVQKRDLIVSVVVDEGRTEIEPGTRTVFAVQPALRQEVPLLLRSRQLY